MGYPRREAVLKGVDEGLADSNRLAEYYEQFRAMCGPDNHFVKIIGRSLDDRFKNHATAVKFAKENKDHDKPCKVSEEFDNLVITKFYRMLSWGSIIRGAKHERAKREGTPEAELLDRIIPEMEEELEKLSVYVERETKYSVVDIKRLVGVQLESGMVIADYLRTKQE